jgi:uncharacterized protein
MSAYLLDVSVLIALSWPGHQFHQKVQSWFGRNSPKGWATCPIVQAGFVRIVSNPAFSPRAVSPLEAVGALQITVGHPTHQFWPDSISLPDAVEMLHGPVKGHQQITDAYLVALAVKNRGKLATLDRGIARLGPAVEVIE